MKSITHRTVTFTFKDVPGKTVCVAGTFNDWSPYADRLHDCSQAGEYVISIRLPYGQHEYKFVVNGIWVIDPKNPDCALSGHGTLNNIIIV